MSREKEWLWSTIAIVAVAFLALIVMLPAVWLGLGSRPGSIAMEVSNLTAALEDYKRTVHVEYPPNFGDYEAVLLHIVKKLSKFDPAADGVTLPPKNLDAAEALVYWLHGYGPNPRDPLAGGDIERHRQALFSFDQTRLRDVDGDGWQEYYPRHSDAPYVYFHHDAYATTSYALSDETGTASAYRSDAPDAEFVHPQRFQIISAGADGHYGSGGSIPSGEGYSRHDRDNVTSFSDGTLGASVP